MGCGSTIGSKQNQEKPRLAANVRPSGRRTERALMRWHTTSRSFKPVKPLAADRFSAGTGFAPIDHKVSGGRFGFDDRAIRVGNWKLVAAKDDPWELYDLSQDRSEMHDLAASHPDKVRELEQRWATELEAMKKLVQ